MPSKMDEMVGAWWYHVDTADIDRDLPLTRLPLLKLLAFLSRVGHVALEYELPGRLEAERHDGI